MTDEQNAEPSLQAFASRDFPQLPARAVDRPHLIETLAQMPVSDAPIVFLEGGDGMGATTLCAQFALANYRNTFYLFIKPASKFAYNPDYLRLLLAEQYSTWLDGAPLDRENIDVSEYDAILLRVRRKAKASSVFFVVDGLNQIPREDARFVDQILREVLPIGREPFRFIISGKLDDFAPLLRKTKAKTFQVIKFSSTESDYMLADVCESQDERNQLEKLCEGNPGRLWSVRRLLTSGTSAKSVLESEPSKYLEFIKLEFSRIDGLSESLRLVLAVLAFGRQSLTTENLSRICNVSISDVDAVISGCMFVRVNSATAAVEFLSETHRQFAEKKLETLRSRAISLQIESLRSDPNSSMAVRLLPSYYQQLNNQQAIVDLLSPEHYERLLEVTESISALKLRAALGSRSAEELRQSTTIFQFALQRAIFSAIGEIGQDVSEVSALVALGQPQRALDIAAQATAKEVRLSLLAAYGRKVTEQGGKVDSETLKYIREAAESIEFSELGDLAGEIAENLVFVDQDLAFAIVDASTKGQNPGAHRDAAYARLSVAATLGNMSDRAGVDEKAGQRMTDKSLQRLLASLSSLVASFSFEDVKAAAEKMDIGRRVYFLRSIAVAGMRRPGVLDVVEYALDQIVGEVGYTPKTRDFSDLASPLAYAETQKERVEKLVKRFESQLGLIGKLATSRDYVSLQMRLAHAEAMLGLSIASDRIAETYYDVASIGNVEIRVECLAMMLRALVTFDKDNSLEDKDGFRSVLAGDVRAGVETLLVGTASHYEVVRGALRALALSDVDYAFGVAGRLNMAVRRDRGHAEIARTIAKSAFTIEKEAAVRRALERIVDIDSRDEAAFEAVRDACRVETIGAWFGSLLTVSEEIRSPDLACKSLICLLRVASEKGWQHQVEAIETLVADRINQVDSTLDQVNFRFAAASYVARVNSDRACVLYDESVAQRRGLLLTSQAAVVILSAGLALLARIFRPLAKFCQLSGDYLDRFTRLCEYVPGSAAKASIFSDLVCRVWCEGRAELAKDLVRTRCVPLLDAVGQGNASVRSEVVFALFVPLYLTERELAKSLIKQLTIEQQAGALYATAMTILRRVAPSDPWSDVEDDNIRVNYADFLEIVEVMRLLPTDASFYSVLASVAKVASGSESKARLSGTQRVDLANQLSSLAQQKLPDSENVQHDGYLIVSEAQANRLRDVNISVWNDLVRRVATVPNTADQAYILLEISECLPPKCGQLRSDLIERALTIITSIPSAFDRFGRLEYYMQIVRRQDPFAAKQALKDAIQLTFDMEQRDEAVQFRRNLVDLADTIEPGLAEKMSEMIDDDPARVAVKNEMRHLGEVQRLRRQLSKPTDDVEAGSLSSTNLPSAAWKNVGALIAGRLETIHPAYMCNYISVSGTFSLFDAYPVLSWYLENCARRFTTSDAVAKNTAPLAEALLVSAELAASVISHIQNRKLLEIPGIESMETGMLVRTDNRASVFSFLREWLRARSDTTALVLCDPYFCAEDMEFLRMVVSECPRAKLQVLAAVKPGKSVQDFDAGAVSRAWQVSMAQDPPETEIVVVAGEDGRGAIHDRWLLAGVEGLRLGTSVNSIGRSKLSEISIIDAQKAEVLSRQLSRYLRRERIVDGRRLQYAVFDL